MSKPPYPAAEITRRGSEIYEQRIRPLVEAQNRGKYLVVDIDTSDYEISDDYLAAGERLHRRHSGAALYTLRIGDPVFVSLGGHTTPPAQP